MISRHRYVGDIGNTCAYVFGSGSDTAWCGRNYSAPTHHNDDDHPFTVGDNVDACDWALQNIPGMARSLAGKLQCRRGAEDPVHNREQTDQTQVLRLDDSSPLVTLTMEYPREELPKPKGEPVLDAAPDESLSPPDSGSGETWSASAAEALGGEGGEPSLAERAAAAVRGHDVVPVGPWPVRQWFVAGGPPENWINPGELIDALVLTGEPFLVDVWWATPDRRVVRVVWGTFLGETDEAIAAAVESWPV